MKNVISALVFSILAGQAFADVYKIDSFRESDAVVSSVAPSSTWFVFDLDNTVITPDVSKCIAGDSECAERKATDGYYYNDLARLRAKYLEHFPELEAKKLAYREAVDSWNQVVLGNISYKLMESDFVPWLQTKVQGGSFAMGHTAREVVLKDKTVGQLKTVGVDFSGTPLASASFKAEPPMHPEDAQYESGIFFVGRGGVETKNHKGKRFIQLLEKLKSTEGFVLPKRVVFFDDRIEHVRGMVEELKAYGIPCDGFHYARIEEVP